MKPFFVFLMAGLLLMILAMPSLATEKNLVIESDPGADSFTSGAIYRGTFNVSISGTWEGTVTLQRSFDRVNAAGADDAAKDAASTWRDVSVYTGNVEDVAYEPEGNVYYRIGVSNGDYTSGTCNMRLGK